MNNTSGLLNCKISNLQKCKTWDLFSVQIMPKNHFKGKAKLKQ